MKNIFQNYQTHSWLKLMKVDSYRFTTYKLVFSGFLNNSAWTESFGLKLQFCLKVSVLESWNIRYECQCLRLQKYLTRESHPAADSALACLVAESGSSQTLQRNASATILKLKDSIKYVFHVMKAQEQYRWSAVYTYLKIYFMVACRGENDSFGGEF